MTLADIRNGIALLIIGLYMILNWGFMLVRVPPGGASGVPVGEILLLFFFPTFIWDIEWLPHFSRNIFLAPFVLWWGLGIGWALAGVPEFGECLVRFCAGGAVVATRDERMCCGKPGPRKIGNIDVLR